MSTGTPKPVRIPKDLQACITARRCDGFVTRGKGGFQRPHTSRVLTRPIERARLTNRTARGRLVVNIGDVP